MLITGSGMKAICSIALGVLVFVCCTATLVSAAPQVKTDKETYLPGEKIQVTYLDAPGSNSDWICIVPAGSADTDAGDYQYMPRGLDHGTLTFESPSLGKYEVRAYYNYRRNGYIVSARRSFSVVSGIPAVAPAAVPPTAAKAPGGYTHKFNLAVFRFMPLNMEASSDGMTVTNTLINNPKVMSSFVVLQRKDLETFLVVNDLQQNDQIDNAIHIGTKLGLNFVIVGTVEKKGLTIITSAKVVSIEKKKAIFTDRFGSMGESDLISNVTKMVDAIIEAIGKNT